MLLTRGTHCSNIMTRQPGLTSGKSSTSLMQRVYSRRQAPRSPVLLRSQATASSQEARRLPECRKTRAHCRDTCACHRQGKGVVIDPPITGDERTRNVQDRTCPLLNDMRRYRDQLAIDHDGAYLQTPRDCSPFLQSPRYYECSITGGHIL